VPTSFVSQRLQAAAVAGQCVLLAVVETVSTVMHIGTDGVSPKNSRVMCVPVHWRTSHACRLIVYPTLYGIVMSGIHLTHNFLFSHRGQPYAINLQEHPGKRWTWAYLLHDVEVRGQDEPVDDEVKAIAQGMAAASEHIDRIAGKQ